MKKQNKNSMKKKKIIIRIILFLLFITIFLLYSRFIATTGLIVNEYKITNSNVPDSYHGLKIVHISDIHYGRTIKKEALLNMVNKINIIKPDIVVLTGDLLDRDTNLSKKQINELTTNLKNINTTIGKYAIMGNHDYSHKEWEQIIEKSGFINLNDDYDLIYNNSYEYLIITGMSSNLRNSDKINDKLKKVNDYFDSLKTIPTDENSSDLQNSKIPKYKIMIMHEPDFIDDFNYNNFDLVLAGHSHNGQIRLPFKGAVILPEGAKKYYQPYYKLDNTDLYISSGMGTSTIDFRLFNRPSINLYRITNK